MRYLGMNKKGLESKIVVMLIFTLIVLVVLLFFSKNIIDWVNAIIDKIFGF